MAILGSASSDPVFLRNMIEPFRQILRGAKPGDIAFEQVAKVELVVNLKGARAIGVTIPDSVLVAADEVIQ